MKVNNNEGATTKLLPRGLHTMSTPGYLLEEISCFSEQIVITRGYMCKYFQGDNNAQCKCLSVLLTNYMTSKGSLLSTVANGQFSLVVEQNMLFLMLIRGH